MAVAITDEHVAVMRAMLAGDFDEYERLVEQLDRTGRWGSDYPLLIAAAFFEAVDRRFGKNYTRADIVQFVAAARERFDPSGTEIDPSAAERLVLSVLEHESVDDLDDETVVRTQGVLLGALITVRKFDSATLNEFMLEARKIADEWVANR
jgi:hypothetical protein